ncbi:MAG: Ig-like domain-containing protein [Arenimonas sp.]
MKSFLIRLTVVFAVTLGLLGHAQAQTVTVTLTAPSNGASFAANTPINVTATATGAFARIRFKQNGISLGAGDPDAPFTDSFTPTTAGNYSLTAEAMQSGSVVATSTAVTVTVTGGTNTAPTVSLTSPSNGASQVAPASFTLTATAADGDGSIAGVKFYDGATLLNTDSTSPYSYTYATSVTGSHSLMAKATDNLGASTTSSVASVSVTAAGTVSVTRNYVYDANERLCKTINPESGATVVDYDAAGNIAWTAEGQALPSTVNCDRDLVQTAAKTIRLYDELNRVTAVSTPDATADVITTYYEDGAVHTLVASNPGGNQVSTSYTYNHRRMLESETQTNGATQYLIGYGYNANGHLSTLTYPDLEQISYAPDGLGRPTQVVGSSAIYASAVTYYPNGAMSGFKYGANVAGAITHAMAQNARTLPSHSQDTKTVGGVTKAFLDDNYVFDANGNVQSITDAAQAGANTRTMTYDPLDRLATANGPWGSGSYGYDALDNLTSANQGARQFRYNYDAVNRLATIKDPGGVQLYSFGYDAQGNTTSKASSSLTQPFVFDTDNRMSSAGMLIGGGVQTYRYDGLGRRVQTTDPDAKTSFWLYSQAGQVLYTSEARRGQNLDYFYLNGTQVATRTHLWADPPTTATVRYQFTDALGSPVASTDTAGGNLQRTSYTPWGESSPTVDGTGYTGHVMDAGTGLTYMQQRYYDPLAGRFYSTDPSETDTRDGFGFSRYYYASNNPYRYSDPDGRNALAAVVIGGGAICFKVPSCRAAVYRGIAAAAIYIAYAYGHQNSTVDTGPAPQGTSEDAEGSNAGEAGAKSAPEPGTAESDEGCVYCVPGINTKSGLDYIGTADDKSKREKDKSDGRDRSGAPTVGKYPKGDRGARQEAEQKAMNERGGKAKLDNKRNEIAPKKWNDRGIDPP